MATIYIDPDWPNTGAGTFANPYKSWASVTWVAGNSYLQAEGTTFAGTIGPNVGGTANSRIIIGVYSRTDGSQVSRKGAASVNATGQSFGMNITQTRPYFIVDGFEVYGATSANITKTATSKSEAQYCIFKNLILRNAISDGLLANGKGNQVINCTIYGNGQDGARFVGDNLEISGCNMYDNGTTLSEGDCCQLLNCTDPIVYNNTFDHTNSVFKQAFIHNRDDGISTGGRIYDNTILCAQYVSGKPALKSYYIGVPSVTSLRNKIEGGEFGAYLVATGQIFKDNIVIVSGDKPVVGVAIRASSIEVSNNTVVGGGQTTGSFGIDHENAANTACIIKNNVVASWPVGIRTDGATYSHNAFQNCAVRNGTAASAEGTAGTGDVTSNVSLLNTFYPASTSNLVEAGTHLSYSVDKAKKQRHNPPTIGAYENTSIRGTR